MGTTGVPVWLSGLTDLVVTVAQVRSLAWELLQAAGMTKKKKRERERKKRKKKMGKHMKKTFHQRGYTDSK